ncbi:NAD(P)-binding domain-containing protein [Rhodococcus fascians]|nr:NAD(P)-binding domain-containing protein [Rhodococcus fascians]
MKIGILGAGSIGATLARQLSGAGHAVKIANSRGPESIDRQALASGAQAVYADHVVEDVDVLITSIPFSVMPSIAPLVRRLPDETVLIDTSNYYPSRDGHIAAVDDGQVESMWVVQAIGRPIAKAWNAIGSASLANKATDSDDPHRVAIPVAADRARDRETAMQLVLDTGFDAFDSGSIADSWRHQPGSPAYSTNLTRSELSEALDSAEKSRLPRRRDLQVATVTERTDGFTRMVPNMGEWLAQLNRAIYM